jgi:glucuronate isomerase
MNFIHDDFLLRTDTARRLYHEVARDLPIIDYHSHLSPDDLAGDRRFHDLFEIWLEGDHYKWRAMRANGVEERYCTGDAEPYEKFLAWARTVPATLRNPLYHWSHLELKRYFGVDVLLNEDTAPAVWAEANARLGDDDRTVHGILDTFKVEVVCTTDDPADDLAAHRRIAASGLGTRVYPTFRPDALLRTADPEVFNAYVERLGAAADTDVTTYPGLVQALERRHRFFHDAGGRLSDHGLTTAFDTFGSEAETAAVYDRLRTGNTVSEHEQRLFATSIMLLSGRLDAEKGWTKQMHLGAMRNTNTRALQTLGPDTGFDSIGDFSQAQALARYLDRLDADRLLPKTILYNLNPNDNYVLATMAGNFQDGTIPGKMQFGTGWWFLDQLEGMTWQMNALSNIGLFSRFVGMLTDSRSFMSFPRHEYFRRLVCDLLGNDVARGELPDDVDLLSGLVRGVCYENAKAYFGFPE